MLDDQKWVCKRCGFTEFVAADRRRRVDELCGDCRARPVKSISYGFGRSCRPWGGEFDEWDNPLLLGVLFLPGVRSCGHRDCVEVSHIE